MLSAAVMSPRVAAAEERYALIVSGVSGTEKFAASQKEWISSLQSALQQRLGFARRSRHGAFGKRLRNSDSQSR